MELPGTVAHEVPARGAAAGGGGGGGGGENLLVEARAHERRVPLSEALLALEPSLVSPPEALEHALHQAREAEALILLLKYQVRSLKAQLARARGH
jgi:hypothetical protein